MNSRTLIRRVVFGLVVLVASQIVWVHTPVSGWYHRAIAACGESIYGRAISGGSIPDIHVEQHDFVVRVGKENAHIGALDITGNICVLLALFAASPARLYRRDYVQKLLGALAVLFVLHVAGLYVIIRTALAWHTNRPDLIADLGPWMYPLVALLWVPYLLSLRREPRSRPTFSHPS